MGPKTLDDLLAAVPGMRRFRRLSADDLRVMLDRDAYECTWCGEQVPPRRQKWCSQDCVDAYQARCDPTTQVRIVRDRDKGVCAECGADTEKIKRILQHAARELGGPAIRPYEEILGARHDRRS